jgi:class 3 adenylate cyclase/tetratricopeptide (TPR) repeat protein
VAERRLVSVLFADLVGFTTIAEGRDPEETRELLGRYFDLAREVVERYAGTIEKFIGDAVMAVWGAPTAQEDDAERSVRAALDLVAAVRSLGPTIQARAGVLTGEAAVTIGATGQGMVAGDLVNTASRLQSAAAPGTVLVGEATRRAASSAIAFEPAGEQVLKGKTAPVPAYRALRVIAERGGRNRAETLEAPFVGRGDELRLLRELFHATSREGRARLVSVIGPAGIGKTRLAWEFLKYIDGLAEEVWWHEGRSPAYGEGISFWALGEMVRGRCGLLDTDDEATTRSRVAATVMEHVPDESERRWIEGALLTLLGVGDGKVGTAELFGAWRTFFERLSDSAIVALVFEDFNNADAGLIDFVDSLLEWSRNKPIYVLTLARPELLERRPDWHAKRNFAAVTLEPLPESTMRELLAGLVPGLPESAVRTIVARADGMPLYAVETVRMLLAEGKLELRDGAYVPVGNLADLAVPETLAALIASRIDSLDLADRALVHDAAVLGQSFTAAGLAAVSGTSEETLEPHLRTLVRREILARAADPRSPERGSYAFVQALVREVAYNTLSHADRKSRHLAAARFFESLGSDELAGAVAGHYLAAHENATKGPDANQIAAWARTALNAAADRAAALGSWEQAAAFAEQALSVATDPAERAALLEQAGDGLSRAARFEPAIAHLRDAIALHRERGDRRAAARDVALLGRCLGSTFRPKEAQTLLEAAVSEFEDLANEPEGLALRASLARTLMLANEDARAVEVADSALPQAERLESLPIIAQMLMSKGSSLLDLGRTHEGLAVLRAGIELSETSGAAADALTGRVALQAAMGARNPLVAIETGRAGLAEARRLGLRSRVLVFAGNLAEVARWTGDWEWALEELESLLEGDLDNEARAFLLASAVELREWRGEDVTASLAVVRSVVAAVVDEDQRLMTDAELESNLGLAGGRLPEARAAAHEMARLSALNAPTSLAIAARAAVWMRDPVAVTEDLAALDATGVHGPLVSLRRTALLAAIAALEGRMDEARTLFDEARRGLIDLGVAFEAALVAIDMATVLGPDDPVVAAAAAEARPVLERLGARPFLERLDAALAPEHGQARGPRPMPAVAGSR